MIGPTSHSAVAAGALRARHNMGKGDNTTSKIMVTPKLTNMIVLRIIRIVDFSRVVKGVLMDAVL